jgi:DNA repair exonuclease SbcCD ATPase subunit
MILLRHLYVRALKQLSEVELWFPRRGSILIEGQNEAGKSTLFEAIYFGLYGAPLIGEEARATLEDLIPHSGSPVHVDLTLAIDETILEIHRTLIPRATARRVTHEARLRVRRDHVPLEEINGPQAVNARLLQEMNGLDGDTLRNSCFMEQKGLDRVERLARDQRDTSVAKLIGIERLRHIEKELLTAADQAKEEVDQLRREYEIATLRQAASDAELLVATAYEKIQAARVRLLLEERDSRDTARDQQEEHIAILSTERFTLRSQLQSATRLQELQVELHDARAQLQEAGKA